MSDAMYLTRLRWSSGGHGIAIHGGVELKLNRRPPIIQHVQVLRELDYAPGVHVFVVQERCDKARDLNPDEQEECLAYLERIVGAARAAAE